MKKASNAGRTVRRKTFSGTHMCTLPAALAFLSCLAIPQSSVEFGELYNEAEIRE